MGAVVLAMEVWRNEKYPKQSNSLKDNKIFPSKILLEKKKKGFHIINLFPIVVQPSHVEGQEN